MSVPTWQFLESAETLYHIILYFASALVVIPTLSAYNGHGFNMTFDYIRRGVSATVAPEKLTTALPRPQAVLDVHGALHHHAHVHHARGLRRLEV